MKAYEVHTTISAFFAVNMDAFTFFLTTLTVRKPEIIVVSYCGKTYSVEKLAAFSDLHYELTVPIYIYSTVSGLGRMLKQSSGHVQVYLVSS